MSAEQNAPRQPGQSYQQLATEQVNPATRDIDRMTTLEMVQAMNAEDASVAGAVARALPQIAEAIEAIAARLRRGGRLIYMGAGTSGRLGVLDASECPPTFNVSPEMIVGCVAGGPIALARSQEDQEDSAEGGQADAARLHIGEADALVGITASGRTAYVLGATAYARERGALTIGLVCNAGSPLEAQADMTIITVVGPEVISGSTRLKAGTAQKMVLNMLSTGVMILLGKTFGNLMVDVQATNQSCTSAPLPSCARQPDWNTPPPKPSFQRPAARSRRRFSRRRPRSRRTKPERAWQHTTACCAPRWTRSHDAASSARRRGVALSGHRWRWQQDAGRDR
ncbi:MAG TPA: N-acetylmuramic acid 6-phosphate etherase [Ktedonobacterales bacterium]